MIRKKKEGKVKTGKHTNKIEVKLDYEKGSAVPCGVRIHKDCTMLDMLLAIIRLTECTCEEANEEGKSLTGFFANCAKAYVDACEDED